MTSRSHQTEKQICRCVLGGLHTESMCETEHVNLVHGRESELPGKRGRLWEFGVMCARIINLNTIKKLRGIKATVMR